MQQKKPLWEKQEVVISCAKALAAVEVTAPVHAGDVVCRDILGTGVDVIAVRDTPKA